MKTLRLDLDAVQVTTFEVAPASVALEHERLTIPYSCKPPCDHTD